jgi:hypothetical protein
LMPLWPLHVKWVTSRWSACYCPTATREERQERSFLKLP